MIDKEKLKQFPKIILYCAIMIVIWPIGAFLMLRDKQIDRRLRILESVCCFVLWLLVVGGTISRINNGVGEDSQTIQIAENNDTIAENDIKEPDETEKTDLASQNNAEPKLPDGFNVAVDEQLAKIPDINGLENAISGVLKEMGIGGNTQINYLGNYDDIGGIITLDAYGVTPQSKGLLFSMHYSSVLASPKWVVDFAKDADNEHIYYVPEEFIETVDLYKYATNELISKKTKSLEDVKKEADKQEKEAEQKADDTLEKPEKSKKKKQEKMSHREGMFGISNKDVDDIDGTFSRNKVRNDTTGNWRISTIAANIQMVDYALSYYEWYMLDDEIHFIVNFNYNTTTCIQYMNGCIFVTVHEYVDGEEHDANLLGGGMVLAQYIVYPDNGDIEEIQ